MVISLTEAVTSKWGKEVKYYLGTTKDNVPSVCIRFQIFVGKLCKISLKLYLFFNVFAL